MKQRYINTKFWNDNWIRRINPLDRYLFLYLLTNEHTNISGIYELPIETIAYESGIDERDLQKSMLPRLEPKIYYIDGWVYIVNFQKHQSSTSETVKRGIEIEMENVPESIKNRIKEIPYGYPMDTPPKGIIYSNSNSNLNSNSNSNNNRVGKNDTDDNINLIFSYWNEKEIIHHTKLSEKTKKKIQSTLKDFSLEEIKTAIDNYAIVINGENYWWEYKWTLQDFLQRGLERFKDTPLENFEKKEINKKSIPLSEKYKI